MAHISRRQRNGKVRYLARYTDPSGRERAKSFTRKEDAERFLTGIENDKLRGTWTDPTLGRVQLGDWYALWRRATVELRPNTEARDERLFRLHILPRFGSMPLVAITQYEVRAWVTQATRQGLAASTVRRAYQLLGQGLDHDPGEPDPPVASSGLGRPEMQVAADLGDDLDDLDHPQAQVDAAAAKPSHLADPKAAIGTKQHQRPIAGPDAVRQPNNLSRGQKAHLPTLDPRQRHPTTGVLRDHAGIHGGAQYLAEQLVSATHGGRSQSLPGRVGHPNAHLVLSDRSQWHRPEAGEDVESEQPLIAGLGVGTQLHRGPTP